MIFYRVKKPLIDLNKLTKINLNAIFEQNEERSRQIVIQVRKKKLPDEDVNRAFAKVSERTKKIIEDLLQKLLKLE